MDAQTYVGEHLERYGPKACSVWMLKDLFQMNVIPAMYIRPENGCTYRTALSITTGPGQHHSDFPAPMLADIHIYLEHNRHHIYLSAEKFVEHNIPQKQVLNEITPDYPPKNHIYFRKTHGAVYSAPIIVHTPAAVHLQSHADLHSDAHL